MDIKNNSKMKESLLTKSYKAEDSHWVEELFPPAFQIELDDIKGRKRAREKEQMSIYEMLTHKITPEDVAAIKNVYERVYLMMRMQQEEAAQKLEMEDRKTMKRESEKKLKKMFLSKRRETKDQTTQTYITELQRISSRNIQNEEIDIQDTNIWNSDEIETLRKVFQTAKSENNKLRAIIMTTQEDLQLLQHKHENVTQVLETRTQNLNEATKANERMHIMCKNLKKELDVNKAKVKFLHEEITALRQNQSVLSKEVHKLRLHSDKERIERQKVELDLRNQQLDAMRELETREEHLNILHEKDIELLRKSIGEVKEQFETEKTNHARTRRGLDHIRTHFASLSLDGTPSSGMVSENQLSKWSYK